jgi:hypothetical protein
MWDGLAGALQSKDGLGSHPRLTWVLAMSFPVPPNEPDRTRTLQPLQQSVRRTHTQARVNRSCGIANLQNAGGKIDSTKG